MKGFQATSAVVTGSSSGIGRATAIALADAGLDGLMIHYRNNESGALKTASLARDAGHSNLRIELVQADLTIAHERDKLIRAAFDRFGEVTTWVNNAGGDVLTGEMSDADFATKLKFLWQIDVQATIELSRLVVNEMRKKQHDPDSISAPPSMVFVGWDQAPRGMEGDAGQMFGPIKAAVMAYANSLSQEVAPEIRVNTVAPGWIQTAWGEDTSDYWDRRAKSQSSMGRWGKPEDVAAAILFVANPDNTFMTGQTLEVNGGWNRTFPKS